MLSNKRLTNWEMITTVYALVRLEASPPLKSPAPQDAAAARPRKITENPMIGIYALN
jgi:hypothetical protein